MGGTGEPCQSDAELVVRLFHQDKLWGADRENNRRYLLATV